MTANMVPGNAVYLIRLQELADWVEFLAQQNQAAA